jgi:hypothetical protein
MPNFFIDRPIFAWVIAIIIMLAGDYRSSAGGAISDDCAASNFHYRHVPRC